MRLFPLQPGYVMIVCAETSAAPATAINSDENMAAADVLDDGPTGIATRRWSLSSLLCDDDSDGGAGGEVRGSRSPKRPSARSQPRLERHRVAVVLGRPCGGVLFSRRKGSQGAARGSGRRGSWRHEIRRMGSSHLEKGTGGPAERGQAGPEVILTSAMLAWAPPSPARARAGCWASARWPLALHLEPPRSRRE